MSAGASNTETLLQLAVDHERLRNVSVAAERVQNVMEQAVATAYDETMKAPSLETAALIGTLAGTCEIGACFLAFGVVTSGLGAAVAAVVGGYFAFISLCVLGDRIRIERDPSYYLKQNFKKAARELSATAAALPDGPLKQSVRSFAETAPRNFVLAHVATIQDRIVHGRDSPAARKRMFKQGIRLIEISAKEMHWTDSGELKAVFSSGRLPKVDMFGKRLSEEHGKLQQDIRRTIQGIQHKP